ncbi:DUF6143 family protein [Clostridium sp. 001]|uniref:DUF6143 family protein n=1 Tax=Clostridium sp. 001 TaxID=1970093 RepID=UPI001C2BEC7D|nr:DUF6143 family protein [Clostridium sp. 001]QXE18340.1 hypothetical protein B5S50_05520 [Clostridium sp. 001]
MSQKNSNYILDMKNTKIKEVVSNPVPLFKSMQGKYFVGQTKPIQVDSCSNAWFGLVNPHNSGVNLFANVFTISNFSDDYLTAEIWLNTDVPPNGSISHNVSPSNTALKPLPKNKVNIYFAKFTNIVFKNGVNVYKRIVPPNTTLVGEEDGKFIERPGGNYTLIIKSSNPIPAKVIGAFGWYEDLRH